MKTKLVLPALSLISVTAFSQVVPNVDWVKYYSEKAQISNVPSAIDANSNVYITGYTYPTTVSADLTTIKYNALGNIVWVKNYNNGGFDNANAITLDATSNVYVTGESDGVGTGRDIVTIKYDVNGNQLWASRFNGTANGADIANAIVTDAAGNVYITGQTTSTTGAVNFVTIKYNASGVQQWTHTFNGTGSASDIAVAIDFSSTNRLFITGTSTNASGNSDIVTIRINPNTGVQMWAKSINGSANSNDVSYALLSDGNDVVIVGSQNNTTTGDDYITLKYNGNNGNILWLKNYDFANSSNKATAITKDATGGFAVTGIALNGAIVEYHTLKYTNSGVQLWVNAVTTGLNYSNTNPQIATDPIANHFYVCGQKNTNVSDIFVYQITPSGNKTWEQTINGAMNNQDVAIDLVVNSAGVLYVAGASLNSNAKYDYTTVRISQTPIYFVPDLLNEPTSKVFSYHSNQGQLRDENGVSVNKVLFYSHNQTPEVYLEKNAYNYVFQASDTSNITPDTLEKIQVNFLGSNTLTKPYQFNPKTYPLNYFLGDVGYPITNIRGYDRLLVPNIYPNIDLHYFSNAQGLKYYFVVKPGASTEAIRINIDGALNTNINGGNNLFINGVLGDIELKQPLAYQVNLFGLPVPITGQSNWVSLGGNNYIIKTPTYNTILPLVIVISNHPAPASPVSTTANLEYSTYYGGSGTDNFTDIKVASNGDRVICGFTNSSTFPKFNALQPSFFPNGVVDAVIMKYTADDTLRFATFFGAGGFDQAKSISLNSSGDIFVGGHTQSTDLLTTNNAGESNQTVNGYQANTSLGFKSDGFLIKLTSKGDALKWSRYVGGQKSDLIESIHIDSNDNLYMIGYSSSPDYPTSTGAYKTSIGTSPNPDNFDAVIGKFNPSQQLQWMTLYGGNDNGTGAAYLTQEYGWDIVTDNSGNVIICGETDALNFPVMNGTGNPTALYHSTLNGGTTFDGFIARLSPSGFPNYSTFLGGTSDDRVSRLVYKSNTGELYFGGTSSNSSGFPFKNKTGAYNSTFKLSNNAFVGYLSANYDQQWTTFYGKSKLKYVGLTGLSVDNTGVVYISGGTTTDTLVYGTTVPIGAYTDNTLNGPDDSYVAVFDANKQIKHAFYFGGNQGETIYNSDLFGNTSLYVIGNTSSSNFPIAYTSVNANLIDSTFNGSLDGFISRFSLTPLNLVNVQETIKTDNDILVYPNPSSQLINIKLIKEFNEKLAITVYNSIGQIIYDDKITSTEKVIDCTNWATGLYIINVKGAVFNKSFKLMKN